MKRVAGKRHHNLLKWILLYKNEVIFVATTYAQVLIQKGSGNCILPYTRSQLVFTSENSTVETVLSKSINSISISSDTTSGATRTRTFKIMTNGGGVTSVEGGTFTTTDRRDEVGSSNSASKMFLVGTTSQASYAQGYSNSNVYATAGVLTSVRFVSTQAAGTILAALGGSTMVTTSTAASTGKYIGISTAPSKNGKFSTGVIDTTFVIGYMSTTNISAGNTTFDKSITISESGEVTLPTLYATTIGSGSNPVTTLYATNLGATTGSITNLTATNIAATTIGTSSSPVTNVYATTFTGALSGNASTATAFSSAASITLKGDITGTASSTKGWTITTTLASSGVTAGSYGASAAATPAFGGSFNIPYITVDAKGRVTAAKNISVTIPSKTMTAASSSAAGASGLVPAPAAGAQGKYLRGDGTWAIPNYAASSSAGGSATSAVKLDTASAGDNNTPVYFSGGKPVACTTVFLSAVNRGSSDEIVDAIPTS